MHGMNRAAFLSVLITLLLVSPGRAQQYEYKDYTVKRGDTLWDISRAELDDNFDWPLIWRENLRINNPDLIYPGQVIRIPVRLIPQAQRELDVPSEAAGKTARIVHEPAETIDKSPTGEVVAPSTVRTGKPSVMVLAPQKGAYIASRELVLASGYITRDVPNDGKVLPHPLERTLFDQYDEIYVQTKKPVEVGQKFYVIRREHKVKHPAYGDYLGYLVRIVGVVELHESGTRDLKATVVEAFTAVKVGDRLEEYYEVEPPMVVGEARRPDMTAMVVSASPYKKSFSGQFDTAFIDKGKADGLALGDVLMVLLRKTDDKRNALIQIIDLRESTALALIIEGEIDIRDGDEVVAAR